ncbi:MAG: hypothetical protein A3H67_01685 [Candidatus Buchananbacteria bacterium RIFCSPLOWO2_02_FULL_46_11b]|uniref:Uncharacterized protein n=3 Tax=Candidatus Buchananiibacteriota TaxID=1817903 RepID=A0A1G1YY83_9BACT|nr:MAG: hypothetical protein A3H67_01685 [Candidatus Buchananbacteria bacterium RIFCSPLOWO2_02_FULL_46_11b]
MTKKERKMKDLRELTAEEKTREIRPGVFFKAASSMALKPDGFPVLVKPTGGVFQGYFPCKVLGPCSSGKVTVQGNRACHVDNVWTLLSTEEAAMIAENLTKVKIDQLEFLNF